jgi:type IV secretion system protein VirB9
MKELLLVAAASQLALAGCAARGVASRPASLPQLAPPAAFVAAQRIAEPAPAAWVQAGRPAAARDQLLPPPTRASAREPGTPAARVEAANRAAAREPTRKGYVEATQVLSGPRARSTGFTRLRSG